VEALQRYFAVASPQDAAWAVYFLAGGKPRQVVASARLRALACEVAGIADWLFEECYQAVGDLAETIAHVLPRESEPSDVGPAVWVEERLLPLRGLSEEEIAHRMKAYWRELDAQGRFLLTKLVSGSFRVGVSKLLVQRALAAHAGVDPRRVAQRMMGYTDGKSLPRRSGWPLAGGGGGGRHRGSRRGQPYPFFLAHQLDGPARCSPPAWGRSATGRWSGSTTASAARWCGAPARPGSGRAARSWSRTLPEIVATAQALPDGTVLDGEIMVWQREAQVTARRFPTCRADGQAAGTVLAAAAADRRKLLTRRCWPTRRSASWPTTCWSKAAWTCARCRSASAGPGWRRSCRHAGSCCRRWSTPGSWAELARRRRHSRGLGVEGFMLKRLDAAYGTGRTKAEGCGGSGRSIR
jgi:DNA ligase-1